MADRRLDRRRQHLHRAVRGNGRPGGGRRRPRGERVAAHRRGGNRDRGLHLPAEVPARGHLHDAGVPRVPLQPGRAHGHVGPDRGHLRDGHDDRGALLGGDRPRDDLRPEPPGRARGHLRHRDRIRALGRPPRRGVGRSLPGLGPAHRRARDPGSRPRRGGRARRVPPGERRSPAHDPAPQPPGAAVDGPRGRDVDPDLLLLRPQPVHHPAHARRALARPGAGRDRPRGGAVASRALRDRDAGRDRASALRGRDPAAGPGLPDAHPGAGADGAARLHPRRARRRGDQHPRLRPELGLDPVHDGPLPPLLPPGREPGGARPSRPGGHGARPRARRGPRHVALPRGRGLLVHPGVPGLRVAGHRGRLRLRLRGPEGAAPRRARGPRSLRAGLRAAGLGQAGRRLPAPHGGDPRRARWS